MIDLSTPEGRKQFYNSQEWANLRVQKLFANPFCEHCYQYSEYVPAVDVHHIKDISDDPTFENAMDMKNLMSLCKSCHARITYKNAVKKAKPKVIIEYKPKLKWKSSR